MLAVMPDSDFFLFYSFLHKQKMECEKNMDKNKWLFDRDEHGELLPKKVFVKALNEDILLTPLTWGEWKRIRTYLGVTRARTSFQIVTAEMDCSFVVDAITNTIYEHSALKSEETNVEQVGDVPK